MGQVKRPHDIFIVLKKKFSWEGFATFTILDLLVEAGYSRLESSRLLKAKSVKVRDTRCNKDKIEWFRRQAEEQELFEPYDNVFVGKRVITLHPSPFSLIERTLYTLRSLWEQIYEWFEDRVIRAKAEGEGI